MHPYSRQSKPGRPAVASIVVSMSALCTSSRAGTFSTPSHAPPHVLFKPDTSLRHSYRRPPPPPLPPPLRESTFRSSPSTRPRKPLTMSRMCRTLSYSVSSSSMVRIMSRIFAISRSAAATEEALREWVALIEAEVWALSWRGEGGR